MNTEPLDALIALKKGIDAQVIGFQAQSDALASAITLLSEGYKTDQSVIDATVKSSLETVLAQITAPLQAVINK